MAPSSRARLLLLCLSAARSAAEGAPGFLAKADVQPAPSEGQQCGASYGGCGSGLECVPPVGNAELGAPGVCRRRCGTFSADGERVNGTCGADQACSGRAAAPCQESAGGCYMYCDSSGTGGSTADRRLGRQDTQICGTFRHRDGHEVEYGECDSGLVCVHPPNSPIYEYSPSICRTVCGSFDKTGIHVNHSIACLPGATCSGRAATPCGLLAPANEDGRWRECPAGKPAEFYMFCYWE